MFDSREMAENTRIQLTQAQVDRDKIRIIDQSHSKGAGAALAARLAGSIGRGATVRLSPEGSTPALLRALTRRLLRQGCRTFTLSFHSPSLKPGCTPYVRSLAERDDFLRRIEAYVRYFVDELGGECVTPPQVRERLLRLASR